MSGVCPRCEGTGILHNGETVPWLQDWTDCPECMDPALPPEPPLEPWEVS